MNKYKEILLTTCIVALSGLPAYRAVAQTSAPAPGKASAAQEVDEVVVTAKFIDTGAESATKLGLSVLDTPYSVAAYSGAFLQAIQTTQIADLYKYMTGVLRSGNTGYDMSVRGFRTTATDRNALMTDGLPGLSVRFGSPPTIGADHVELVKGPASLLYGQVEPGGFVNIITKKPAPVASTMVELQGNVVGSSVGHGSGALLAVDSTGPLTKDGSLLYRFVAQGGSGTTFRTNSHERPIFVAPSLTWRLSQATSATLQFEYRRSVSGYDSQLVTPQGNAARVAPLGTSYQSSADTLTEEGETTSLTLSHNFDDGGRLNFAYRDVQHTDRTTGFTPIGFVGASQTRLSLRAQDNTNTRSYDFADLNYTRSFETGPISHKLIIGANIGREMSDFDRQKYYVIPSTGAGSYTLDVYNPSYAGIPTVAQFPTNQNTASGIAGLTHSHSIYNPSGAYISDLVTFNDQFKALLGVRYSKESQHFTELRAPGVPSRAASVSDTLPTVGLIYEPNDRVSFYTSYSTSFVPVPATAVDASNQNHFSPTTAHSIEAGVKADLLDNRLNVTAAVFKIDKQNVTSTFTIGCPVAIGSCTQQIGAERSTGLELEVNAKPAPGWQVLAGYSHLKAIVSKSAEPIQVGALLANVPADNAHLWTRYDVPQGQLAGLGFGLGVSYVGRRNGVIPTAKSALTLPLDAYTTVDAAVYYAWGPYEATLKVSNLADAHYLDSAGTQGSLGVMPGGVRKIETTLRARF